MGDLPAPGLEPMSLALAGGFSTTAPPGSPLRFNLELSKKYYIFSIQLISEIFKTSFMFLSFPSVLWIGVLVPWQDGVMQRSPH